MKRMPFAAFVRIATALVGDAAMGHGAKKGDLQIDHAWAPATRPKAALSIPPW